MLLWLRLVVSAKARVAAQGIAVLTRRRDFRSWPRAGVVVARSVAGIPSLVAAAEAITSGIAETVLIVDGAAGLFALLLGCPLRVSR